MPTRRCCAAGEVLSVAQRTYAEAGFDGEWRFHHQGGLLGYQPREHIARPGDTTILRAGMAVAWNPSIAGVSSKTPIS